MAQKTKILSLLLFVLAVGLKPAAQPVNNILDQNFINPPASSRPWVFWYWMHAAVSKEGITADLEAMKEVGIGGAYLMPIKDTSSTIPFQPARRQLTPEWWALVKFAMQEAKRLDLKLAMHLSDGFALAGGPWITPELSMQKLTWSKTYIKGGGHIEQQLQRPPTTINFYKDIAVFAYPANSQLAFSDITLVPSVTTSNGTKPSFLSFVNDGNDSFRSDSACWIQYKYPEQITCRSVKIHTGGNNYQAQRLIIQSSNDGIDFKTITRLEPPRHGWQDTDEDVTHSIPATRAQYFRFVYDKDGSEPGAEDLDAAKWKPSLKVMGIYLSDEPVIHQYESKNGSVWRISKQTTIEQLPDESAVSLKSIINISDKMDANGKLRWESPPGNWVIVRIGHTSTAHTNATGGAGKGLECDKFNSAAIKLQFDKWFGQAFAKTDPALAKEVLKVFHVDSWECGSQNWSTVFRSEFQKRRGYDLMPYLIAMTGVPINDINTSEKFLFDIRQTIAELVNDIFYKTLVKLAHEKDCRFSAESVAPTMVSDGILHYKNVDVPMGEFWLNSPTHDKPNDMLDAISGAHIYGKNIIQAEAFTSVRMNWKEHPGNLKALGDRNFALGINKMVLHVFTHNPWMDRKPGMTLDGVGLYFQRDQTWFKQGKAWIDYLSRCQYMLQQGKPVVDIAVFTGEELPRRSILPDRLVNSLPGIFGKQKCEEEQRRLANDGQPLRTIPDGVSHSANMADPEDWIDPLNGYAYDSFNPDALMMASVKDGRIVLPGGASYGLLIIPGKHVMKPNTGTMSLTIAKKLLLLANEGATILMSNDYVQTTGLNGKDNEVKKVMNELFKQVNKKGKLLSIPYLDSSFSKLGLQKDVEIIGNDHSIAWTHRASANQDIYFITNQKPGSQVVTLSFRINGRMPEQWDPVTMERREVYRWKLEKGRTVISLELEAGQSQFIVFRRPALKYKPGNAYVVNVYPKAFSGEWQIQFDTKYGGPASPLVVKELKSWTEQLDIGVKYYSGTAIYSNTITWDDDNTKTATLKLDSIYNIASIKVNGIDCGTLWTRPYELDISKYLKPGVNKIEIAVSNTWHNRLIGDQSLPAEKRVTWTTAPFRLKEKPLEPAGIIGRIVLEVRN